MISDQHKCASCKRIFPASEFPARPSRIKRNSGWGYCRECSRQASRRWAQTALAKATRVHKEQKEHNAFPLQWMLKRVKGGAKKRGILFNIKPSDLSLPLICPVLGIPLKLGGPRNENTPSVDRLDSSKGYVPGNVVIISWRANRIKNNGSAEEHRLIAKWMDSCC